MFHETEITIIDLSDRPIPDFDSKEEQVRALITEVKLLRKLLDDATEQRDEYKRQLDRLNLHLDRYIKREIQLQRDERERKIWRKQHGIDI